MACIKQLFAFNFILAIIVCRIVVIAGGRQLKALKKPEIADNMSAKEIPERQRVIIGDVNGKIKYVPTQTGNSPGIGHSFSVSKAINYTPKETGNSPGIGHSSSVSKAINYTPKETGNSPGIGHSSSPRHPNVEGSIEDVKAGHSPGIGHASQNEKIGPNV